jgi:hypothetical protein
MLTYDVLFYKTLNRDYNGIHIHIDIHDVIIIDEVLPMLVLSDGDGILNSYRSTGIRCFYITRRFQQER